MEEPLTMTDGMAVLTPITRPHESMSGPPLLPATDFRAVLKNLQLPRIVPGTAEYAAADVALVQRGVAGFGCRDQIGRAREPDRNDFAQRWWRLDGQNGTVQPAGAGTDHRQVEVSRRPDEPGRGTGRALAYRETATAGNHVMIGRDVALCVQHESAARTVIHDDLHHRGVDCVEKRLIVKGGCGVGETECQRENRTESPGTTLRAR